MWTLLFTTALGIFLMVAPTIFGYENTIAADNERIVGPIIATFAITAIWEATRVVRKFNLPFSVWLILAPLVLSYESMTAIFVDVTVGILVTALLFISYPVKGSYGGGWNAVWKSNQLHQQEAKKQTQTLG